MSNEYRVQSSEFGVQSRELKTQNSKLKTVLRLMFVLFTIHYSLFTEVHAARPLVTEDAVVAGKGITQLELGIDYTKAGNRGEGMTLLLSPILGVMEDTEFSLKVPYIIAKPYDPSKVDGWGDTSFIMKHLLVAEDEKIPAFLIRMALKLPTGDKDKGLGTGDTNVGFLAALTKNFNPATIHMNIGYTFVGNQNEGRYNNEVNYGIAGEYGIGKKIRAVGEVYGLYHPDYKVAEIERRALLGLTYRIDDTFTIDLAAKRGLEGTGYEYGFVGGATITF